MLCAFDAAKHLRCRQRVNRPYSRRRPMSPAIACPIRRFIPQLLMQVCRVVPLLWCATSFVGLSAADVVQFLTAMSQLRTHTHTCGVWVVVGPTGRLCECARVVLRGICVVRRSRRRRSAFVVLFRAWRRAACEALDSAGWLVQAQCD